MSESFFTSLNNALARLKCKTLQHDYRRLTPRDVTPFVQCTRCGHTGWVL